MMKRTKTTKCVGTTTDNGEERFKLEYTVQLIVLDYEITPYIEIEDI